MQRVHRAFFVSACLSFMACIAWAEDARYFANRPLDLSLLEFFYTRTHSTTGSDDQLPLVGINAKFDTVTLHYRRYLEWQGQTAFWSVQVPSVEIKAADDSDPFGDTRETGVGDPTLMMAGNFYGRPALDLNEADDWRERPALGWATSVTLPLGEYDAASLVNAGNNRWIVKPQVHATQPTRMGLFEAGIAMNVYGDNDEFWGDWQLRQQPLWELNLQLSHDLTENIWWWWGAQGFYGGRAHVDNVPCERAREYNETCADNTLVDNIAFSEKQDDWRANVGVHIEMADGVLDIVLQRVISDTDGDRQVEVGKVAYSTRW